jgi:type II secretory ATPase GspE/PulE/Tfp pilus assembly ATPase PilB-like protein
MSRSANVLQVAACEPDDPEVLEDVGFASGLEVEVLIVPHKVIAETIDSFYSEAQPVCKLVNLIVLEAIELNASAVHVIPHDDGVGIQYQIDGELVDRDVMPRRLLGAVIYRIKTLFGLDVTDKEHVLEGEARAILADGEQRAFHARVVPTTSGPSAILRIAIPRPSAKS